MFEISGNGIKTERDRVAIQFDRKEIETVVNNFRVLDETTLRFKYDLQEDSRDWKVASAKLDVQQNKSKELFRRILYRPFDLRHTWYSGVSKGFIGTPAAKLMHHLIAGENMALICLRQSRRGEEGTFFVGQRINEQRRCFDLRHRNGVSSLPLWRRSPGNERRRRHDAHGAV